MTLTRNLCLFFLILFLIISSCKKEELISTPDITISLEGEYDDLCTNENNEILIIGSRMDNDPYGTNAAGDLLSGDTMTQVAYTARYSFSEVPGEFIWLIEYNDTTNLFKTDFNNNMVWTTEFALPDQEFYAIWSLRKMGGYYYALGSYYTDQWVLCFNKYDEDGNKIRSFRNEINGSSEYFDVQFIEMDNGTLAFIEPVYPDEGCSKWNNCYILQIFK